MSDGDDQDSPSRFVPESILRKLLDTGVILDVIVIGGKSDGVLKSISLASGGLAFEPSTIEEAMKLTVALGIVDNVGRPNAASSTSSFDFNSMKKEMQDQMEVDFNARLEERLAEERIARERMEQEHIGI